MRDLNHRNARSAASFRGNPQGREIDGARGSSKFALLAALVALSGGAIAAGCATTKPEDRTVASREMTTAELSEADLERLQERALDVNEALKIVERLRELRDKLGQSGDPVDQARGKALDDKLREKLGLNFDLPAAINKLTARVKELSEAAKPGKPGNEVAAKNLAELEAQIAGVIGVNLGIEGDLARVRAYLEDLKAKAAAGDKAAQKALESLKDLSGILDSKAEMGGADNTVEITYLRNGGYQIGGVTNPNDWKIEKGVLYFKDKAIVKLPKKRQGTRIKLNTQTLGYSILQ